MTGLVLGKNCMLQFDISGSYVTYGCAKDFTLETTTETKQVRTVGDGKWKKTRHQSLSYTLSFNSLMKLNDAAIPSTFDTYSAQVNGVHLSFRLVYQEMDTSLLKVIKGTALPVQSTFTASPVGFAQSSFTLEGFGAPVITDALVECSATIASGAAGGTMPNRTMDLSGVTGSPFRYDYTIDGAVTIYTAFAEPFTIAAAGQSAGGHVMLITPYCVNGFAGTPLTINYTN